MRQLSDMEQLSIASRARVALGSLDMPNNGCSGGYLCVADSNTGMPLLIIPIGTISPERIEKCYTYAIEKAKRLSQNSHQDSSYESRVPEDGKWGGACRGKDLIFSFAGLSEMADEAISLRVALDIEEITTASAIGIAMKSNNQIAIESISTLIQH